MPVRRRKPCSADFHRTMKLNYARQSSVNSTRSSMRIASPGPSRSVTRASLYRQKNRSRRLRKAANDSSKIASRAGITSTCRRSWPKPMISKAGRRSGRRSPPARWCHGNTSTCLASTISPMKSCSIIEFAALSMKLVASFGKSWLRAATAGAT